MTAARESMSKTALDEACEDARHYHHMWKAAEAREARLKEELAQRDAIERDVAAASVADSVGQLVKDVMILRAAKRLWDQDVNDIERRSAYNRALIRVLGK